MEIRSLDSSSFRNLRDQRLELGPRLNLVVGDNGQGKTNLLEALALVAGRPSFRTTDLSVVPRNGTARAELSARVRSGSLETPLALQLVDGRREHFASGRKVGRLAVQSVAPSVFLTAWDLRRLVGPPADRRRSLDRAAHALHPEHARALTAYEKARALKNRLLASRSFDADELAVYEDQLVVAGGAVAFARRHAREHLETGLARHATALGSPFPRLTLRLDSDLPAEGSAAELTGALERRIASRRAEERAAGRSLVGPHRDDLVLLSAGIPVAERASSGESRTFLLAWTLAELTVVEQHHGTAPFLAFDDFDSEWDPQVLRRFAAALPSTSQVFLTSARPEAVLGLPFDGERIVHRMRAGHLRREELPGTPGHEASPARPPGSPGVVRSADEAAGLQEERVA